MIFVTVGTMHFPFDRLMRGLSSLPAQSLVVQHGPADPPPGAAVASKFVGYAAMARFIDEADVVITHSGCGTILMASRAGHTPIVVPRLKRFGEHVDDHQEELARSLSDEGKVIAVWDVEHLGEALASVPPRRIKPEVVPGPLHMAVRDALTRA